MKCSSYEKGLDYNRKQKVLALNYLDSPSLTDRPTGIIVHLCVIEDSYLEESSTR